MVGICRASNDFVFKVSKWLAVWSCFFSGVSAKNSLCFEISRNDATGRALKFLIFMFLYEHLWIPVK